MRQDRKLRLLGLGMALVVIAVPSVAGIHAAASPTSAHRAVRHAHRGVTHVNVRSQASINRYLRSIGVNPATAVVQKGLRNYAGPNCPGADWNCTSANAPVVQLADPNGQNTFVCSPESAQVPPTNQSTNTCAVVQGPTGDGSDNVATCILGNSDNAAPPGVAQSCSIMQTNATGNNKATVRETITQHDGTNQEAHQHADVMQTNGSGDNIANIAQGIDQDTHATGKGSSSVTQDQLACQDVSLDQSRLDAGKNSGTVNQSQSQKAHADSAGSVTQGQDSSLEPDCPTPGFFLSSPNQFSDINQDSGAGKNDLGFHQNINEDAHANTQPGPVDQQQGIDQFTGGLDGHVIQNGVDVSTAFAGQTDKQSEHTNTKGSVTQFQDPPAHCCANQFGNTSDMFTIDQSATLTASDPNADQNYLMTGTCDSFGQCDVDEKVVIDHTATTNSCDGPECNIAIGCPTIPEGGGDGELVAALPAAAPSSPAPCSTVSPPPDGG